MGADNLVECGLGLEPQLACPRGIEALGPASDDPLHKFVRRVADPCGDSIAGDAAKRFPPR